MLSVGNHRGPEQGRCLMEHVSELAGEPFGELPRCTHPALAALAAQVNDRCGDAGRRRLARRAEGLLLAGGRDDPTVTWRLVAVCDRATLAARVGDRTAHAARRSAARADRAVRRWERVRLPGWAALAVSLRALGELTAAFHRAACAAGPPGSTTRDDALVALLDAAVATTTHRTTPDCTTADGTTAGLVTAPPLTAPILEDRPV